MIKFEGFELKNTEDSIINRQPSTRPFIIGKVLGGVMGALGAKKGSSSWEQKSFLTKEQQDAHKENLQSYKDLKYEGPGDYKSGQKAGDLEGYKATTSQGLEQLQKEDKLSVSGIEQLRNLKASSAATVRPDIEGLRKTADEAWSSGAHHMDEVRRRAGEELAQADIRARRGAAGSGLSGTALQRLGSRNVMDYGRTVGTAAARVAEQTAMQRQQLKLQGYGAAGQLGMATERLGAQGLQTAGDQELRQLGIMQGDLAQRRSLGQQDKQFAANRELDVAKFSENQAQAQNLWAQQAAANKNQFALNRLSGMNTAATTQTFKNVKNVTKGSSGLGGALITAGATVAGGIYGGPAGASAANQLSQGFLGSMGYDDGGGAIGQLGSTAAMMYAGQQGAGPQGLPGAGTGVAPPDAMPSWYGSTGDTAVRGTNVMADAYGAQGGTGWGQGATGWLRNAGGMQGSYDNTISPEVAQLRSMQGGYQAGFDPSRPYNYNPWTNQMLG